MGKPAHKRVVARSRLGRVRLILYANIVYNLATNDAAAARSSDATPGNKDIQTEGMFQATTMEWVDVYVGASVRGIPLVGGAGLFCCILGLSIPGVKGVQLSIKRTPLLKGPIRLK